MDTLRYPWLYLILALALLVLLSGCALFTPSASTQDLTVTVHYGPDGRTAVSRVVQGPAPYVALSTMDSTASDVDCTRHQSSAGAEECERRLAQREMLWAMSGGGSAPAAVASIAQADSSRDVGVTRAAVSGLLIGWGIHSLADWGKASVEAAGSSTVTTTIDNRITADDDSLIANVQPSATLTQDSATGSAQLDTNDSQTTPNFDSIEGGSVTTSPNAVDSDTSLF